MKNVTITALGIAFKIWVIAVLINTIADTIFINGFQPEFLEITLLIGFFASLFSLPVFLILWAIIYNLLHAGRSAVYILKFLLLTGVGLAVATWFVFAVAYHFFEADGLSLAIIAPVSGALAICINLSNIKKACYIRDAEDFLIENLGNEQPVT